MPALISSAEATSIRAALSILRVHVCTVTPRVAGAPDAENNVTYTNGTPVTGVPCKYRADDRVRIDETGQTLINVPTVTVAHDLTVVAGDAVSNVRNSEDAVLLAGPLTVDYVVPSAGFGPTLSKRLVLRAGDAQ